PHTHTAILLHGRGSTAKEFADDLLTLPLANGQTLPDRLPSWRLVFPSAREVWSPVFQEFIPAWFEDAPSSSSSSLADPTLSLQEGEGAHDEHHLQASSLQESVRRLSGILDDEIALLGGDAGRVALVGISQGAAVGLWTLLGSGRADRVLGGFVGASGWLPFAKDVSRSLNFFSGLLSPASTSSGNVLSTPVLLCHGTDDAYVDIDLGRAARAVLTGLGMKVEWREYSGAEQEGHWFKEPEEIDDVVNFL
ncbi:hypothetical protein M406DRAFT_28334, partial [Cryphonectria parasitica EP155]